MVLLSIKNLVQAVVNSYLFIRKTRVSSPLIPARCLYLFSETHYVLHVPLVTVLPSERVRCEFCPVDITAPQLETVSPPRSFCCVPAVYQLTEFKTFGNWPVAFLFYFWKMGLGKGESVPRPDSWRAIPSPTSWNQCFESSRGSVNICLLIQLCQ